ncbi:MAG: hypothetical protein LUE17_17950 [Planctomycetaceae bacterium]|nr:hypothetical protein [Planctomycetaceae bacterium]
MESVIGILLLVSYIVFAIYAARGGNLILGFFVMAVLWSGLGALAGVTTWKNVNVDFFQGGPANWGGTAIIIIFGSWFGRIMVDTNIAGTIIRKAVELGGDKPGFTCMLVSLVVGIIFTTSYGAGAVVSIGVIAFPILLSLGISKSLAISSFMMAVGSGMYINMGMFSQVKAIIGGFTNDAGWRYFSFIAMGVQLVLCFLMVFIYSRKTESVHGWAAPQGFTDGGDRNVTWPALITPVIPVIVAVAFNWQYIPSILLAVIWGLAFTGNLKSWTRLGTLVQKTFNDGVADLGLVFGFVLILQMFIRSTSTCAQLLAPILQPVLPENVGLLFIVFGVLCVLALFRGPLTLWGSGVATVALLEASGLYVANVIFPLFYIPSTSITASICPTQSWNSWAVGYVKIGVKDYLKVVLPFAWLTCVALSIIAYLIFA